MVDDPLQELRYLRRKMEHACEEKGQTYAEYLSQAQRKYTERLVISFVVFPHFCEIAQGQAPRPYQLC